MSDWDTSALIKVYVAESDSALFEQHYRAQTRAIISARIALWEARATLRRKEAEASEIAFQNVRYILFRKVGPQGGHRLWIKINRGETPQPRSGLPEREATAPAERVDERQG